VHEIDTPIAVDVDTHGCWWTSSPPGIGYAPASGVTGSRCRCRSETRGGVEFSPTPADVGGPTEALLEALVQHDVRADVGDRRIASQWSGSPSPLKSSKPAGALRPRASETVPVADKKFSWFERVGKRQTIRGPICPERSPRNT